MRENIMNNVPYYPVKLHWENGGIANIVAANEDGDPEEGIYIGTKLEDEPSEFVFYKATDLEASNEPPVALPEILRGLLKKSPLMQVITVREIGPCIEINHAQVGVVEAARKFRVQL
jgi:hypothetical protein